jgi:hypothetical protein
MFKILLFYNKQRLFRYTAWIIFLIEVDCVLCAVRIECLYTMQTDLRVSVVNMRQQFTEVDLKETLLQLCFGLHLDDPLTDVIS